ncbi:sensor histidine kinase [Stackebrandtia sp.]|uniref:sensor histidine kinase n=1 Tax=Stackebrandtia sp. TaxID=2023065 RepID=UPI0032C21C6A
MMALVVALAVTGGAAGCLGVALARSRRAHRAVLGERGWLLEREREAAARSAVDAERARIAHDLHDIVSHNVSLMVVQASAASEILRDAPGAVTEALGAVENAGRDAMTELRHLLGLLAPPADGSEPADLSPQPSLDRLSPLIDRIAFAGLPVEVRVSGERRALPPGVDATAFRVVQEALTNALRHGDGERADVSIRYGDRYLRLEVTNSGPSVLFGAPPVGGADRGAGRGLMGLRERVAVYGGDLDARGRLGGGWRVRARIPLEGR